MIKKFNIPLNNKVEAFQAWLNIINWTLGHNKLTDAELEIFSYILVYNDKYKEVKDKKTRSELLFSTSIKKKIREEFNISVSKFETYLNKLRKKGIIVEDCLLDKFDIFLDSSYDIVFSCVMNTSPPIVEQYVPVTENTPIEEVNNEEEEEDYVNYDNPLLSDFPDKKDLPQWDL